MSELSAFAGSEVQGAGDDEGDWGTPQQAANRPARAEGAGRFSASVYTLALLAGFFKDYFACCLLRSLVADSILN